MKNKKYDISFVSSIAGLNEIEECRPKPASRYIPQWWKDMPTEHNKLTVDGPIFGNAKICPSFADYFSKGYIMPMWTDTIFYYDSDLDIYKWSTSSNDFAWEMHPNGQYLQYSEHKFLGKKSYFVLKMECPWMVFSNKKYSMYQLPTYFNFNDDYSVIPGVRNINVYNVMNIQFLIHSDKKEIFIKRGTPIAHFIPFEINDIKIDVRSASLKDEKEIDKFKFNLKSKFFKTYKHDKRK